MLQFKSIFKIISILVLAVCAAMLLPSAIALYCNEIYIFKSFLVTILAAALLCGGYLFLTRKNKSRVFLTRDAFFFVTMSWLSISLLGSFPYFLSGVIPSFTDAFFESVSGFSTTGATILPDIESLPKSIHFWRCFTSWVGGMGIVVLTVAVFPLLGVGGLQLVQAEAPGVEVDKITPRVTETAKIIWLIYLGFTVAETILLMLGGMNLFDALTHTFSTVSSGGMSSKSAGIAHFNSAYIECVIIFFMFLSGVSFSLHYRFISGNFSAVFKDSEFRAYVFIIFAAALLIFINMFNSASVFDNARSALFHVVSFSTTNGFSTNNYENWPSFSQMIIFCLFFIGACSGSTSGGFKVIRFITLLKQSINEMKLLLHPRGVFILKIGNTVIKKNIIYSISGFFFLYAATAGLLTFVVAASGEDILTSLSAVLATLGCVGPAFGSIGSTGNYAFMSDYVKWVLAFAMIIGRLEFYTVIILFTSSFWKKP
ncbi:MAG: TrkH family potassium uptake protein [Leptospirales bacterium]|nr:TrkH family potassium uptake protein [Leptospirales bacterium]